MFYLSFHIGCRHSRQTPFDETLSETGPLRRRRYFKCGCFSDTSHFHGMFRLFNWLMTYINRASVMFRKQMPLPVCTYLLSLTCMELLTTVDCCVSATCHSCSLISTHSSVLCRVPLWLPLMLHSAQMICQRHTDVFQLAKTHHNCSDS